MTNIDIDRQGSATKTALQELEARLTILIATKFDEAKKDIICWVFGIAVAQAALILAVLRLFPSPHY